MSHFKILYRHCNRMSGRHLLSLAVPFLLTGAMANAASTVPKWERFEKTLESTVSYANPAQDASLQAEFVAPSGEKKRIYGFWDGANTWRIRFAPDQEGKWSYKTTCSDLKN